MLKLPPGGVFSCSSKDSQPRLRQPEIEDFTPFWEAEGDGNNTRNKREVEMEPEQESPLSLLYSKSEYDTTNF